MESRKKVISNILIVCFAGTSIVSGYKVYDFEKEYKNNQKEYNDLSNKVEERIENNNVRIDFDKLKSLNPDIEGWIKYEDTHIDYPVVQGNNNSKYLRESFEGDESKFGTLFIDAGCNHPFEDFTTIIYGHHMRDGSMFGDLKKLKDVDFYNNHPELELYTEDKDCVLEICAFLNETADSSIYSINITDEKDKKEYINTIKKLALYQTDIEITSNDKLVILSTCAYETNNARYIVVCKLVDKYEYLEASASIISREKVLVRKRT